MTKMTEPLSSNPLVQELRNKAWASSRYRTGAEPREDHVCWRAADEIARLRAENTELRDKLIAIGQKLHGATDEASTGICGRQFETIAGDPWNCALPAGHGGSHRPSEKTSTGEPK
jgi:hypothetical protein